MRTILRFSLVLVLSSCEPKGPYLLTVEKILAQQEALPGEVFQVQGSKVGT